MKGHLDSDSDSALASLATAHQRPPIDSLPSSRGGPDALPSLLTARDRSRLASSDSDSGPSGCGSRPRDTRLYTLKGVCESASKHTHTITGFEGGGIIFCHCEIWSKLKHHQFHISTMTGCCCFWWWWWWWWCSCCCGCLLLCWWLCYCGCGCGCVVAVAVAVTAAAAAAAATIVAAAAMPWPCPLGFDLC